MAEASVEAARLALAARDEYSKKRRSSRSLERAAFYIVMNERTKQDLVGSSGKASPGRLEDIGSLLLEEAQRCNEELRGADESRSVGDGHRLTPVTFQALQSDGSRSQSRNSKSRARDSSRHKKHHKKQKRSLDSKSSEGAGSATSPSSAACDSTAEVGISTNQDATLRHMTTTMTTTASDDNEDVFEASSTALTTASTPEDFLSNNNSLSLLMPRDRCGQPISSAPVELKAELKSPPRRDSQSSSSSYYERQREALLKLNGVSSSSGRAKTPSSVNRLSSTVSSVFERQGSSALLNPFSPDSPVTNPITNTSANSKPVSPVSLVVAGLVMLTGTCAFLVSFALGRQGTWTLAASVVMGTGAVLVFSGLCWYLAHTSAPAANSKTRVFSRGAQLAGINDVEIKVMVPVLWLLSFLLCLSALLVELEVVDRQQLDKLIKQGARVETVNTVSVA